MGNMVGGDGDGLCSVGCGSGTSSPAAGAWPACTKAYRTLMISPTWRCNVPCIWFLTGMTWHGMRMHDDV